MCVGVVPSERFTVRPRTIRSCDGHRLEDPRCWHIGRLSLSHGTASPFKPGLAASGADSRSQLPGSTRSAVPKHTRRGYSRVVSMQPPCRAASGTSPSTFSYGLLLVLLWLGGKQATLWIAALTAVSLLWLNRLPELDLWAPYFFGAYGLGFLAQRIAALPDRRWLSSAPGRLAGPHFLCRIPDSLSGRLAGRGMGRPAVAGRSCRQHGGPRHHLADKSCGRHAAASQGRAPRRPAGDPPATPARPLSHGEADDILTTDISVAPRRRASIRHREFP